jgi:hypothetical protein
MVSFFFDNNSLRRTQSSSCGSSLAKALNLEDSLSRSPALAVSQFFDGAIRTAAGLLDVRRGIDGRSRREAEGDRVSTTVAGELLFREVDGLTSDVNSMCWGGVILVEDGGAGHANLILGRLG